MVARLNLNGNRFIPGRNRLHMSGGASTPLNILRFPSNETEAPRMIYTAGDLLAFTPASYIWEVTPAQQTGYYTTFFWGNNGSFQAGNRYAGFHPYPVEGNTTVHNWEISARGNDYVTDDNGNNTTVVKGVKYTQAAVLRVNGANYELKFYWDLPSTSKIITYTFATSEYAGNPSSPCLVIGGAPWATATENLSGDLGRWKIMSTNLSQADVLSEAATLSALVTSAGQSNIWWGKTNWASNTDLTCNYGTGRSFSWVDSNNKATLVAA